MKNFFKSSFLLAALFSVSFANATNINMTVAGMHCGGCKGKVQSALETEFKATDIKIDVKKGDVTFTISEKGIDETKLKAVLDKAGYKVSQIKMK